MTEIINTEELSFRSQEVSIGLNCELKPRSMNVKTYSKGPHRQTNTLALRIG